MKYLIILAVFSAFFIPTAPYREVFDVSVFDSKPAEALSAGHLVELSPVDYVDEKVSEIAPGTVTDANYYRDFIFQHESGWRLDAVNWIGCYGLGQDCNNVLETQCPNWRVDLDCQLKFWEDYAIRRYGSWEASYYFWLENGWW